MSSPACACLSGDGQQRKEGKKAGDLNHNRSVVIVNVFSSLLVIDCVKIAAWCTCSTVHPRTFDALFDGSYFGTINDE